ncbi:hypothetical protein Z517_00126 [Fonsecaea pedrosoi CBS 271.37]|uniref:Unplaced genomic scaffold supercont1.1, whole genome shotgun sequence n=1 Tax=Fonsecaea pedrosoi CBS 271.37 TaxID=1442368 RepID=A0A0D2GUR9_9EURO|nr:uncharacterized protein Z517_00126 [Fonsecaea pedrosoi CBS 271.37]KIW84738.1 hypothetical protein Z517_00126 [Fonsecaea pedrosoi CBS 271.37]
MSRYNPNWGRPNRNTPNNNADEAQPPYRANPIFSPDNSQPNNSSPNLPPTGPSVAPFQPTRQGAPPGSSGNRALPQPGGQFTPRQANTNWKPPPTGGRGGHPPLSHRPRQPQTGHGGRGGRLHGDSKPQGTRNVDIPGKELLANHFAITLGTYQQVFSYELSISRLHPEAQNDQSRSTETENGVPATQKTRNIARQKKRRLVYLLLEQLKLEKRLPDPIATDYLKLLITPNQLDEGTTKSREFDFYDEFSVGPDPNCDRYRVEFETPKLISLTDLFAHYGSAQPQVAGAQLSTEALIDATNALNIIFSYLPYQHCFSSRHDSTPSMTTVNGQTFYGIAPPPPPRHLGPWMTDTGKVLDGRGGRYSIPGFSRSVRGSFSSPGHVDLNIYIKTGCFWQHGSVQDVIDAFRRQYPTAGLYALQDFLRRAPVRLAFQEPGLDRFSGIKGLVGNDGLSTADRCDMRHLKQQHSGGLVRDYFSMKHSWQMDAKVNVVKIGKESQNGHMTVPANLLQILPGRLKPSEIPRFSTRFPDENYKMIVTDGRRTFYSTDLAHGGAAAFRLSIDSRMARVPVTVLARPSLMYKISEDSTQAKCIDGALIHAGQWNIQGAAFVRPASGKKWSCVELTAEGRPLKCSTQGITHFVDHLTHALRQYGMQRFEWWQFNPNNMGAQQYADNDLFPKQKTVSSFQKQSTAITKLLKDLKANGVQLVVLLIPVHDLELYSAIKRAGDQKVGIATVCHVLQSGGKALWPKSILRPGDPQGRVNHDFLANLCMKINLKVDETAVNQALHGNPKMLTPKTMIIGIDVAHGGGPRKHCPSVAAVVGSVNAEFSQWPASLLANPCSTRDDEEKEANEKILNLDQAVYERLLDYYNRNHDPRSKGSKDSGIPDQIIVYRDGVSESQFAMCKDYEYEKIGAALSQLFQQKGLPVELLPKVTLICAIKRHHTRLFPNPDVGSQDRSLVLNQQQKNGSVNNNPVPGCVVMDRITYGQGNDFFLVGQKAIQGTAIPVHYNVLRNPRNYDMQDIARMTYHLCYLFGRSRTSVGPCNPVYYADLVADRARCFVRQFYNPPRDHDQDQPIRPFDESELGQFNDCLQLHPDIARHMFYI